ncbi:hypothetical protein B0H13DRAFT_2336897 [Mycena leptocephala]|nr:hypothetical protein B0H13DRAFT_2336897 [Mycena leptocephala]
MALRRCLLALYAQTVFANTPADVLSRSYDYLIVGGGLAGLTLANRLTEIPTNKFSFSRLGKPTSTMLWSTSPVSLGPPSETRPTTGSLRPFPGRTQITIPSHGAGNEIDAIGALGNPGWMGENLLKYMRKTETFTPHPAYAAANNLTFIPRAHGTTGPLHDSFSRFICYAQKPWLTALETLGVHKIEDLLAGERRGLYGAFHVDGVSVTRSYAAQHTMSPSQPLKSRCPYWGGTVQFLLDEETHAISVKPGAEVILSTGTIKTPQILELSGIGDPQILNTLGIHVKVDLPGVGEGMIDQFFFGVSFELKNDSIVTLDDLRDPAFLAGALGEYIRPRPLHTIIGEARAESLIDAQARKIAAGNFSDTQKQKWDVIIQGLREPMKRGYIEPAAFTGFFATTSPDILYPGGREEIYDAHWAPPFPFLDRQHTCCVRRPDYSTSIDPHYFEQDIDLEVMVDVLKYLRKLGSTGGFKNLFASETDPGALVQTDEEIMQYIKNHGGTEYHAVGSAAMLPQEKGGVVSPELKSMGQAIYVLSMWVCLSSLEPYSTCAQYSILPIQTSAHPMSALYGIAEKAADIIRGIITV